MSLLEKVFLGYTALMSVIGFFTAMADKRRARRGAWRVPEKRFLLLALTGGGVGVLAGFFAFRHKTKHTALVLGVLALTILYYAVIIALFLLL